MSFTKDKNILAFFAILRAGLWEEDAWISSHVDVDFEKVCDLSREQSVLIFTKFKAETARSPTKKRIRNG